MFKKYGLTFLIAALVCFTPLYGVAADYWVTPVGAGSGDSINEPMAYSDFVGEEFQPGDVITFLSNQTFPFSIVLDGSKLSGIEGSPVTIKGDGNTVIDVSCCHSREGVRIVNANYLRIENLSVIGSGGAPAFLFSGSGSSGQGFTVVGVDLEVVANNENDFGSHDGISVDRNSEVYLIRPRVRGTRPKSGDKRSHQSITAHLNGHVIIEDADFANTNFWAVPVDSSTITFYGGRFTESYVGSFEIGGNGDAGSFIKVIQTAQHPVYIEMDNISGPKSTSTVSNLALVEINGGEMHVMGGTELVQTSNRGRVNIINMDVLTISSDAWRYFGLDGSRLTLMDNKNVQLRNANNYFFQTSEGASIDFRRNAITASASEMVIFSNSAVGDEITLIANNFLQSGASLRTIWLGWGNKGSVNIHQNNFIDGNRAVEFSSLHLDVSITNNNFVNLTDTIFGDLPSQMSNNNFYNAPALGNNPLSLDISDRSVLFGLGYTWWSQESPLGIDGVEFSIPANIGPWAIIDPVAPNLRLFGENPFILSQGREYIEPGFEVNDDQDGDISGNVLIMGAVDVDRPGSYTINYSVQNSYGMSAVADREVIVRKPPPAEIKGNGRSGGGGGHLDFLGLLILLQTYFFKRKKASQNRILF